MHLSPQIIPPEPVSGGISVLRESFRKTAFAPASPADLRRTAGRHRPPGTPGKPIFCILTAGRHADKRKAADPYTLIGSNQKEPSMAAVAFPVSLLYAGFHFLFQLSDSLSPYSTRFRKECKPVTQSCFFCRAYADSRRNTPGEARVLAFLESSDRTESLKDRILDRSAAAGRRERRQDASGLSEMGFGEPVAGSGTKKDAAGQPSGAGGSGFLHARSGNRPKEKEKSSPVVSSGTVRMRRPGTGGGRYRESLFQSAGNPPVRRRGRNISFG